MSRRAKMAFAWILSSLLVILSLMIPNIASADSKYKWSGN